MQQLQNASDSRACARGGAGGRDGGDGDAAGNRRRYRADGKAGGVTLVHIRALGVLRKRPGATLSMLSDQLALTISATSRLVDAAGRETTGGQNRAGKKSPDGVAARLTPAGSAGALEGVMREAQDELGGSLKRFTRRQRRDMCEGHAALARGGGRRVPEKRPVRNKLKNRSETKVGVGISGANGQGIAKLGKKSAVEHWSLFEGVVCMISGKLLVVAILALGLGVLLHYKAGDAETLDFFFFQGMVI